MIDINSGDEEDPVEVLHNARTLNPKSRSDRTRFTLPSDYHTENSGYSSAPDKDNGYDDDDAASTSQDELFIWLKDNYCELVGEDHDHVEDEELLIERIKVAL